MGTIHKLVTYYVRNSVLLVVHFYYTRYFGNFESTFTLVICIWAEQGKVSFRMFTNRSFERNQKELRSFFFKNRTCIRADLHLSKRKWPLTTHKHTRCFHPLHRHSVDHMSAVAPCLWWSRSSAIFILLRDNSKYICSIFYV